MNKYLKRALIAISILLVLLTAAGFAAGNYFYELALVPGTDRSVVFEAEHNTINWGEYAEEEREKTSAWLAQTTVASQYLTSHDGLRLHANRINALQPTHKWVLIAHGYSGYGMEMAGSARHFQAMGYNALLPDARGCGQSEGGYIGMGWPDRLDYIRWLDEILAIDPDAEVVLYGVSMGGATVLMMSGETLPANVKVIVEDCGYTSAWDEFSYQLKGIFGLPAFPLMHFSTLVTRLRAGYFLGEANALRQVAKSTTPTFFIHGSADTFVPAYMAQQLYDAATCPKDIWVVEGAEHGASATTAGNLYWQRVEAFISTYIS